MLLTRSRAGAGKKREGPHAPLCPLSALVNEENHLVLIGVDDRQLIVGDEVAAAAQLIGLREHCVGERLEFDVAWDAPADPKVRHIDLMSEAHGVQDQFALIVTEDDGGRASTSAARPNGCVTA